MARPLRIEFPGALYHVMSRGHRQEAIYQDGTDRKSFLDIFADVVERFNWRCYAYCQMTNHYHLVVRTVEANLSAGMQYLNGVYTQASNRRHKRVGHVFQGRYKAMLVDAESYFLELARYIVLNPVRAVVTRTPAGWAWSSYRATAGQTVAPEWLDVNELLGHFATDSREARKHYVEFVRDGVGKNDLWSCVQQQVYLGDEEFVKRVQENSDIPDTPDISRAQRRPPAPPIDAIAESSASRDCAILKAYRTGAYSYADIGRYFGLHPGSVGRIVRRNS